MSSPQWHPSQVLGLDLNRSHFTCSGTTRRGQPCTQYMISSRDISEASEIINKIALCRPMCTDFTEDLEKLAYLTLCPRWHRRPGYSQVSGVASKWQRAIDYYRATSAADSPAASAQYAFIDSASNSSTSVDPVFNDSIDSISIFTGSTSIDFPTTEPTTAEPTTAEPNTAAPTAAEPTRVGSTSIESISIEPAIIESTTAEPITESTLTDMVSATTALVSAAPTATNSSTTTSFAIIGTSIPTTITIPAGILISSLTILSSSAIGNDTTIIVSTASSTATNSTSMLPVSTLTTITMTSSATQTISNSLINASAMNEAPVPTTTITPPDAIISRSTSATFDSNTSEAFEDVPPNSPASSSISTNSLQVVTRRPIAGDCPICLEPLNSAEDAVWCRAQCGQNCHRECFDHWKEECMQRVDYEQDSALGIEEEDLGVVTCVYCRTQWEED